ncbi:IclR family transcriptional regulator [Jiella sonneratiae]|uniref:IclR family transcriptional regulator n=1 Tax=Jiella sonneratiae TaxID=2816856 RepID=A0ABS3J9A1_9HYPH|nr:IclR family transcriptional regulator [Jiella sonneratiae]MBO0906249.1 IclR family transcriptional regulator [Jiella sonneratiae]
MQNDAMLENPPKLKTKGVEAVDKALRILSLFGSGNPVLSLGEISERSGLVKSSALRLLISLQNAGFIAMTEDRRYTIGVEMFRIGRVYQQSFQLEALVRPVLQNIVRQTGESGSYFRREGDRRVCLYREDSDQPLREHVIEGEAVEIGKGAAGHVFKEFGQFSGDVPIAPEVLARLPIVVLGERGPDIAGISAPVYAFNQGMIGAIALSGPRSRFVQERMDGLKHLVLQSASQLSGALRSNFYQRLAVPENS